MKTIGGLLRIICIIATLILLAVILRDISTEGRISATVWDGICMVFNVVVTTLQNFADTFLSSFRYTPP